MQKIVAFGPVVGGVLMFAAALIVCLELFLRNVFTISLAGADEISSYLFAVSVAWALPHVMLTNTNIRIDVVVSLMPRWIQDWVLRIGTAFLALFLGVLTARAVQMAWLSYETEAHAVTPLQTPLVIPQSLWALGLLAATLAGIYQLFRRHTVSTLDDEIAEHTDSKPGS